MIIASNRFSLALSVSGDLWIWGKTPWNTSSTVPKWINSISSISNVSTGGFHLIVILENRSVYSWGLNTYGKCGLGLTSLKVKNPKRLDIYDIDGICAGPTQSYAWTMRKGKGCFHWPYSNEPDAKTFSQPGIISGLICESEEGKDAAKKLLQHLVYKMHHDFVQSLFECDSKMFDLEMSVGYSIHWQYLISQKSSNEFKDLRQYIIEVLKLGDSIELYPVPVRRTFRSDILKVNPNIYLMEHLKDIYDYDCLNVHDKEKINVEDLRWLGPINVKADPLGQQDLKNDPYILASGSSKNPGGIVNIWSILSQSVIRTLIGDGGITCLHWINSKTLAVGFCNTEKINFAWRESVTKICLGRTFSLFLTSGDVFFLWDMDPSNEVIVWLWEILEEFNNDLKILFLIFVSGRSRLPTHAFDVSQRFQILRVERPENGLVTSSEPLFVFLIGGFTDSGGGLLRDMSKNSRGR
ncbi:unnamed protein product [Lepeophtheirus salmonis]|uniref:(salmon louse) hypothetical protein n=1 Tax=Lepeophtheirus salmonis TaxID=72036 RepID=A0A7R8CW42_LEPSM|nr:unnamed protein product [Lepeophtheirus salmonis]CAF2918604.1 unnamed protein product [Lepeophtheirus salmonis]